MVCSVPVQGEGAAPVPGLATVVDSTVPGSSGASGAMVVGELTGATTGGGAPVVMAAGGVSGRHVVTGRGAAESPSPELWQLALAGQSQIFWAWNKILFFYIITVITN